MNAQADRPVLLALRALRLGEAWGHDVLVTARVVVTADTPAGHLATAYGTPSVVLFGQAAPEQWGPPADGPHRVRTDASVRRGAPFAKTPDPALPAVWSGHVHDAVNVLESGPGFGDAGAGRTTATRP